MKLNTWHKLTLAILLIPTLEMFLLIQLGSMIGPIPALIFVVGTAALGAYCLRQQGLTTWERLRTCIQRGEMPTEEIIDSAFVLAGGLMLLTPGIFTDLFGITCIVPASRRFYIRLLTERGYLNLLPGAGTRGEKVIEGTFEREE